jgi:hypothetical protein
MIIGNQTIKKFIQENGATASRPSNAKAGQMFFNTTLGKPIWYNGSLWKDAIGNIV